jgi:TRAP-type C4-dicarboxylate transport system permease small subunit
MSCCSLKKFYNVLLKTETGLLVGLLSLMIIVAVIQIVMRNFMGAGLLWAESLLRITVLWLALLGSMVASRNHEHIAIDVLVNKLPRKLRRLIMRLTRAVTSGICFVITWYSLKFVIDEYQYGGIAFGIVPHWLCEAIIPISLGVMAMRYLVSAFLLNELDGVEQ